MKKKILADIIKKNKKKDLILDIEILLKYSDLSIEYLEKLKEQLKKISNHPSVST